jgi:hypothetical protein
MLFLRSELDAENRLRHALRAIGAQTVTLSRLALRQADENASCLSTVPCIIITGPLCKMLVPRGSASPGRSKLVSTAPCTFFSFLVAVRRNSRLYGNAGLPLTQRTAEDQAVCLYERPYPDGGIGVIEDEGFCGD